MFDASIWTILFWLFVGLAIGGLISWLLGARTDTETARGLDAASFEGKRVTVREDYESLADQLEAIEGVGPKIAGLFHKSGVFRFAQVAAMTPVDIGEMLRDAGHDFDIARPDTWPFQANLLANGWIDEFLKVKEALRAGRFTLRAVDGIGPATSERLHGLGIASLATLSDADAGVLSGKLKAAGEEVSEGAVQGWIEHAKRLMWGDAGLLAAAFGLPAAVLEPRTGTTFAEHRNVDGKIVDARALASLTGATATATARPSLLPFWIGLLGAALMALLSALGLGRGATEPAASVAAPAGAPALISENLVSDASFETDSAVLTDKGKAEIESQIIQPALGKDVSSVRIVGHADVRGDAAHNLELSRNRALSVSEYMRQRAGELGNPWQPGLFEVIGAGDQFPDPDANTKEACAGMTDPAALDRCYAPDRRVTVDIVAGS
ncbi:OmpA family protein [Altererythrobacter salegens]|uniref:OmpA family protein n=1 Tax=Croceibacterium salegens TaxID=1737568 RepID=A0A6I4SS22_9SPHN|nr:OmpA family protein [Croceibacterium salegens]MXO58148.1 OmpA family protein [Croceibacterium salegens]